MKSLLLFLFSATLLAVNAGNIAPGKAGGALELQSGEYAVSDDTAALNVKDKITLALWVKASQWGQMSALVNKANSYGILKRGGVGCYFKASFKPGNSIDLTWAPNKYNLKPGEWYHLTMTYDAAKTEAVTYLNGIETARENIRLRQPDLNMSRINPSNHPFCLGKGGAPFAGLIDSVYLYDRVLSGDEIRLLMEEKTVPGARLAWLFNENASTKIVHDSSGNNHHGKIVDERLDPKAELPTAIKGTALQDGPLFSVFHALPATKVFRRSRPLKKASEEAGFIAAELAANEWESFQMVLTPKSRIRVNAINVSELKNDSGAVIPENNISVRRVAYVPLTTPSQTVTSGTEVKGEAAVMFNKVDAKPGFYPDPLPALSFPLELEEHVNLPLWITVRTAPDTPAGLYHGSITAISDDGKQTVIPYAVKVWNFALPEKFHTANHGFFSRRALCKDQEQVLNFFNDYYVTPDPVPAEPKVTIAKDGRMSINTADFDREAAAMFKRNHLNVLFFPGFDCYFWDKAAAMTKRNWQGIRISETPGKLTPQFEKVFRQYLRQMSGHLREKGWFDKTRFMLVDEPSSKADWDLCRQLSDIIKQVEPELPIMLSRWPTPETEDIANHWSLGFFQVERMAQARARGDKFEWYPNWHVFIDRPALDTRMIGFNMWKHGLSGIFIWCVSYGWDAADSESVWRSPCWVYPDGRTVWGNGLLIYPDRNFNPVSSIRFEAYRDTFEDYEYLYRLNQLIEKLEHSGKHPEKAAAARKTLEKCVTRIVFRYEAYPTENRWREIRWETDEQVLFDVRRELARTIEELSNL